MIIQTLNDGHDPLAGRIANFGIVIDYARDRGARDSGTLCDFFKSDQSDLIFAVANQNFLGALPPVGSQKRLDKFFGGFFMGALPLYDDF